MGKSDNGPLPTTNGQEKPKAAGKPIKRIAAFILLSAAALGAVYKPDLLERIPIPASVNHCLHSLRSQTIEGRVSRILTQTPLIDGHNDLAILLRAIYKNKIEDASFTKPWTEGGLIGHADIPRLRQGQNGGAFWSVFWLCPPNGTDYSDEVYASSVTATYHQIDLINRLKASYPEHMGASASAAGAIKDFKAGKLISPLGIEGLHQIGNSATNLRAYYDLGVRYATLTHNCGNKYADAALWEDPLRKAPAYWGGVSPEGRKLINEMNRIGMIVDLSHTSVDTQVDVFGAGKNGWEGSKAPVIYSHSSAYGVCPHPRNVQDHVLEMVKERDSLVMVNFAPEFVSCKESGREDGLPTFVPEGSTLEKVVDHIVYIGEKIGYEHVGLGSDFDGIPTTPKGLEDVSKFPDLVAELLRRGVSDEHASKVVGGNLLRVWADVDRVAAEMQKNGERVLEDDVEGLEVVEGDLPGYVTSA
ncbi:microsomal dipeptidase precursor [Coniochaeta sp. 2T2.1]|nr:microsomal dipeptidase precursor [Coniochaeta sp. 2T2.1]